MGIYFILLLWLIQAATSQETNEFVCNETCGDVVIPSPFGITTGCYKNSWFRVTCNKTANGLKPFISRINLELLDSFWSDGAVAVNNPVTYLNCGNKGTNGTTRRAIVNLEGSPFFFSSRFNIFGSVGCGNLAIVSREIQTDPLASCVQQRCDHLASKFGGCYAVISENLTSYTATMTEIINPGKQEYSKRCASAFIFDLSKLNSSGPDLQFPDSISIDTTHVPATLEWNSVNCDLGAALCQQPEQVGPVPVPPKHVCTERCGKVNITYPFGIKVGCYMNEWFRISCKETDDGPKPFIRSINMQLLSVSFSLGRVIVNNSVTYFNCRNKSEDNNGVSVNLTGSPFFFSDIFNRFVSVGCGSVATILRNLTDYPVAGCLQPHCSNIVTSNGSCLAKIPPGLSSFAVNMTEIYPSNGSKKSCGSAFVVDVSLLDNVPGTPEFGLIPTTLHWDWGSPKDGHVPTALQWGRPIAGQCELKDGLETFCSSSGQYCWARLSVSHLCVCSADVNSDNDYHDSDVCQEIGKCGLLKYRYCDMLCLNAPDDYCSSPCPYSYQYSSADDSCNRVDSTPSSPKNFNGLPAFSMEEPTKSRNLPIIIGCSTSIGTVFVLLGTWYLYKVLKRRKTIKMKQKYFRRNGGLLLQQQLSSNEGNVEKIRLFTSKELEKATDYYSENRILGQGGQGTVYKGNVTDGSIVAIKKSKMVEEKKVDEKQLEQFINEVILLSQINHRNVVKLLGCCLETKVPLLVYEFIPNGTLSQLIHDQNEEFPLTWEMRLRIAIEIADALSYLHSAASVPIYHRDIKSGNILLDGKYRAKVSDFGISRSIALEQTHLTTQVQGTFGYLDPEYFRSNQFTEKSDVYSFGVVLVELLTGQKPISSIQSEEVRSLVNFFLLTMKENSLFDILDPMVRNNGTEEEIIAVAKLAKRSLNLNGKKRPTMKQIAKELERIRASEEANAIEQSVDEYSDTDDMIEPSAITSCSTSRSIINDSVTLPMDTYS
ncbi:wall-associated receptor kinase-like 1 [Durio zibethinus]|uniref:Wall-associated receptor kinase-like 1 n=1 Tax=Durio zibethinus TaxID=66656 RepID=A0A6P5X297_DURZI|nr:wall-associated receptor kinase-like 1 [Durio zibethinus]